VGGPALASERRLRLLDAGAQAFRFRAELVRTDRCGGVRGAHGPARGLQLGRREGGGSLRPGARLLERELDPRPLCALDRRRFERGCESRPLALRLGERFGDGVGAVAVALRALELGHEPRALDVRGVERRPQPVRLARARGDLGGEDGALGQPRRDLGAQPLALREDRRQVDERLLPLRRLERLVGDSTPAAHGVDDRRELAERALEHADVALGEAAGPERDEDQAPDGRRPGIEGHARDRAHRRALLHEARHVAVLRRALDEVRTAVEEALERHVPRVRIAAPHALQPAAPVVGEPDFRHEAKDRVARRTRTRRRRPRASPRSRPQGAVERVLGERGGGADLRQPLAQLVGETAFAGCGVPSTSGLSAADWRWRRGFRRGPSLPLQPLCRDAALRPAHPHVGQKRTARGAGCQRNAGRTRSAKRRVLRRSSTRPNMPMKCVTPSAAYSRTRSTTRSGVR
jgi:hypothetical protein